MYIVILGGWQMHLTTSQARGRRLGCAENVEMEDELNRFLCVSNHPIQNMYVTAGIAAVNIKLDTRCIPR